MTGILASASALAAELHRDQRRKGTDIPYVSHLLAVCALVLEDGGSEVAASGALLHDAAEDQGGWPTVERIRSECGSAVADLVVECSDSLGPVDGDKPPWRERKQAALEALPDRSGDALLIIAADKLHNARATLTDLELGTADVWSRFKTGRTGFLWYHRQMASGLERLIPHSRSVAGLTLTVRTLADWSNGERGR